MPTQVPNSNPRPSRGLMLRLQALLALCCLVPGAVVGADATQISAKEAERARVQTRIEALQRTLENDRDKRNLAVEQLRDLELQLGQSQRKLDQARSAAEAQERALRQAELRRSKASDQLRAQNIVLANQLRAAYMMGRQVSAKLVFAQSEPGRIGRVSSYYDYIHRARQTQILGLRSQLDELTTLREQVKRESAKLKAIVQSRESALSLVERQRAERQHAINALESGIKRHFRELEQLEADRAALDDLLASLRTLLADIPVEVGDNEKFSGLKGRLTWPLRGELLARFGDPKAGGQARWNGIWIAAKPGAPVRAVAGGRIAYVGWMLRYGLIAIVEHSDGYYSLYGHNQSVWKQVGEWIQAGEVLAAAGDSGGQARAGLYLEIRSGRDPKNPLTWLAKR